MHEHAETAAAKPVSTHARLEKMERSLRRTRLGMAAAGAVAAVAVLAGWGASDAGTGYGPDVLKVRRLAVVNDEGQEFAVLAANRIGGGLLRIQDERGRKHIVAGAGSDGGYLTTYHEDGHTLTTISVSDAGSGMILNYGTRDKPLVTIGASGEAGKESGAISVNNWRDKRIVRFGSTTRASGYVTVFDEWGNRLHNMGLD